MKKWILTNVMFVLCFYASSQSRTDVWAYDLDFLKTELAQRHFNLFAHLSEKEFNQSINALKKEVERLSDLEIALSIQQIICKAQDAHTSVQYTKFLKDAPIFPILSLYWFSDGIYIDAVIKGNEALLGKKIIGVNGHEIETIIERLKTLIVPDNESLVKSRLPWMLNQVEFLKYLELIDGNKALFKLENEDGSFSEMKLEGMVWEGKKDNITRLTPDKVPFAYSKLRTWFWQEYFPEEKVLYVQYNRCSSREVVKKFKKKDDPELPSFRTFEKEVMKSIKDNEIEKLVFDMRHNGGGYSPQGTQLIKKISGTKLNGEGKIYVVTGRRTFSSALLNTLDFKKETDAILIGEPTGGKPNHFGEVRNFVLPNSKLKIYYSTKYFKKVKKDIPTIKPDIEIKRYFEDFKSGRDPVWEYILQVK